MSTNLEENFKKKSNKLFSTCYFWSFVQMWVFSSEIIESKISILVSPNIIAADIVQEIMFPDFFVLWVLKSAVRVAYSKPACSASHQVHNC